MTHAPRPDRQLMAIARLAENHAQLVTETRAHIRFELTLCDGYGLGGDVDDGSRSTDTTSTTEAAFMQRQYWDRQAAQINDDTTAITAILDSLGQTCRKALGTRTPRPEATRCYTDPGLTGYIHWVDAGCNNIPRSSTGGMCDACRTRARRWRDTHAEPALTDERTIEHDPIISVGQRGVIHAYMTSQRQ